MQMLVMMRGSVRMVSGDDHDVDGDDDEGDEDVCGHLKRHCLNKVNPASNSLVCGANHEHFCTCASEVLCYMLRYLPSRYVCVGIVVTQHTLSPTPPAATGHPVLHQSHTCCCDPSAWRPSGSSPQAVLSMDGRTPGSLVIPS